MDSETLFRFDRARHTAAAELRPEHYADFQRLLKLLRFGPRFQLLLLECIDEPYRDVLIERIDRLLADEGLGTARLALAREAPADFATLEAALRRAATEHQAIHLLGGNAWFDDERLEAFNIRREAIARDVSVRLLLWGSVGLIARLATRAPDLWSWRAGVFAFPLPDVPCPLPAPANRAPVDARTLAERGRRIAEIHAVLEDHPELDDTQRLALLDELASLYESLGELDEALRIRREEQLPVYERLGDVRERAVTLGKIADVLAARGELDEALRIRREEELPVYERLGDVRERAVTLGKIADVLAARGELDEALRLYREEALPVYERLGAVRERAVTLGQIADVLATRGELDEALRIRREEQLPVYERLGDVRARAVTLGQIADVLARRGELDEALRLYREEALPVYERLDDQRELLVCRANIAVMLLRRNQSDDRAQAESLLRQALTAARRMRLPEAAQIEAFMRQRGFELV